MQDSGKCSVQTCPNMTFQAYLCAVNILFYFTEFQVVAGKNFFVKVHVGNNECVHVRIYQNWSQELEMSGVQEGKNLEDPIEFVDRTDGCIFESSEGRIYKTPSGNIVTVRNGDSWNGNGDSTSKCAILQGKIIVHQLIPLQMIKEELL